MIFFSNLCLQVFQKWYAWTISEVSRTNKHNFLLQPANINLCVWLMETVWRQLVRLYPAVFRNLAVFLWSGISGWSALKIWKHILMAALFLDAHHCYMWSFPVFVCVCVCVDVTAYCASLGVTVTLTSSQRWNSLICLSNRLPVKEVHKVFRSSYVFFLEAWSISVNRIGNAFRKKKLCKIIQLILEANI